MKITVAALQFMPHIGDIDYNLKKISSLLSQAKASGASLCVLPEICDIGYEMEAILKLASEMPNRVSDFFSEEAIKHKMIIVPGLAEKRNGKFYNIAAVFAPDGSLVTKYEKVHLCKISPFNEPKFIEPGSRIEKVDIGGVRLGLSICFDIRFPEIYRKLLEKGAEIIAHPTAFPKIRVPQLAAYCPTRAMENQFFFIMANAWGEVGGNILGGNSMIVSPTGEMLARAPLEGDTIISAEIDLSDIEKIRREIPIVSCRRPDVY